MHYKYCPECGTKLIPHPAGDDGDVPYCSNCNRMWFDSFSDCVLVLVYDEFDELALSSQWYLPKQFASFTTGYMKPGETAEEAAAREVQEELGLTLQSITYAGTYWFDYNSQLMHGFIGCAKKAPLHLSTEVQSAKWVPAAEVPGVMLPDFPGNAAMTVFRQYIRSRGLPMPDIPTMTPEQQKRMMRATKEKIGSK